MASSALWGQVRGIRTPLFHARGARFATMYTAAARLWEYALKTKPNTAAYWNVRTGNTSCSVATSVARAQPRRRGDGDATGMIFRTGHPGRSSSAIRGRTGPGVGRVVPYYLARPLSSRHSSHSSSSTLTSPPSTVTISSILAPLTRAFHAMSLKQGEFVGSLDCGTTSVACFSLRSFMHAQMRCSRSDPLVSLSLIPRQTLWLNTSSSSRSIIRILGQHSRL
jgi:hypothetical protein